MSHRPLKGWITKNWLERQYLRLKKSTNQIAKEQGVHENAIRSWLVKFGIPRRSLSVSISLKFAKHCKLSEEATQFITGELLGDGCLFSVSPHTAKFQYGSKHLEYINWISNTLKGFGINQAGHIRKVEGWMEINGKGFYAVGYYYCSLSYDSLRKLRIKHYPNGKRIIPRRLKLTPLIVRQMYIGNGSLMHRKGCRPRIILSQQGFSISDVNYLTKKLCALGFNAARQPSNNVIGIACDSVKDFLDYIGECPKEIFNSYGYKWELSNDKYRCLYLKSKNCNNLKPLGSCN